LRLYNEKSDVIRSYYSLTHHSRSTSSTMSFASWTSQCVPLGILPLHLNARP